jgi:hypothetical protein
MDQLHEQEFTSILIDALLDVAQTFFYPCVGPIAGVWLLAHHIIPSFYLSFAHFFITLHIRFGIPHLTISHISRC